MTYYGLVLMLLCVGVGVRAYPTYVPTEACTDMFPTGHNTNAQSSTPPFELLVSPSSYTAGSTITVTLNTTQPATWYFEGMFVQARRASDCGQTTPVGTFSFASGDTYLQTMTCSAARDAISHKINVPTYTKGFTWTAPNTPVGHVYFRATVVRNEKTFWTGVASGVVRDPSAAAPAPSTPCAASSTSSTVTQATTTTVVTPANNNNVTPVNAASPFYPHVLPLVGAILVALLAL